jgi:hypothetical protein
MLVKIASLFFFLFTVWGSYAETIIIPVRGDILQGADASYITTVEVTNLDTKPVSVRVGEMFPVRTAPGCPNTAAVVIQPLETVDVPTGCIGLYAYTLEADGKVRVDAEVLTSRVVPFPPGFTSINYFQQFETSRTWLLPGRLAVIPRIWLTELIRTNVFVVNPNDRPINFELNTIRRSPSAPQRSASYTIGPKSMSIVSPSAIDDPVCRLPLICGYDYKLTFTADGPYYAISSSVMPLGDAHIGSPSLVNDQP